MAENLVEEINLPDHEKARKQSNGSEIEDRTEHSLHGRDNQASMDHKLTQGC